MCALVLVIPNEHAEAVLSKVTRYPCVNHVTKVSTAQPNMVCAVVDIAAIRRPEFYQQVISARNPGVIVTFGVQPL